MSFILLGILNSQVTAAAGGPAYDLLETQALTSTASSVEFTGLGSYSDYQHLELRCVSKCTQNFVGIRSMQMQLNSDTSNAYARHTLGSSGASPFSQASSSTSQMEVEYAVPTTIAGTDDFGAAIISILDFSNTSKNTTVRSFAGAAAGSSAQGITFNSGLYTSTNAVTSIKLFASYDFRIGSRFSLYGVK